jgi:hypothetical protein
MNLRPPPEVADVQEIRKWCAELYRFLQYPAFQQIKLIPRSSAPTDTSEGVKYYDSDDHKEKTHDNSDWRDTY